MIILFGYKTLLKIKVILKKLISCFLRNAKKYFKKNLKFFLCIFGETMFLNR